MGFRTENCSTLGAANDSTISCNERSSLARVCDTLWVSHGFRRRGFIYLHFVQMGLQIQSGNKLHELAQDFKQGLELQRLNGEVPLLRV